MTTAETSAREASMSPRESRAGPSRMAKTQRTVPGTASAPTANRFSYPAGSLKGHRADTPGAFGLELPAATGSQGLPAAASDAGVGAGIDAASAAAAGAEGFFELATKGGTGGIAGPLAGGVLVPAQSALEDPPVPTWRPDPQLVQLTASCLVQAVLDALQMAGVPIDPAAHRAIIAANAAAAGALPTASEQPLPPLQGAGAAPLSQQQSAAAAAVAVAVPGGGDAEGPAVSEV